MEEGARPEQIAAAEAAVQFTRNAVSDLTNISDEERTTAVAALAQAEAALRLAQSEYDKIAWAGQVGMMPQALQLEQATIAYGYGMSATPLLLAQAYAAIANGGKLRQPTFIQGSNNPPISAIDPGIAQTIASMLETVPTTEGTGSKARVANYRIAGKTGTSRKASASGYAAARYVSSFAGFGPASNPRLVCVVVINDPTGEEYYGGLVAAPLFAEVMTGAMRIMNIPPDDYPVMLVSAANGTRMQ
jgi:cell division protein FtsI/penicillin-binding protein 2